MRFYQGDLRAKSIGPEGPEVRWIESDDQAKAVIETLRMLKADGVPTQDVVILSPRPLGGSTGSGPGSSVGRALREADCEFTFDAGRQFDFDAIRFESIGAFKGLESPVVIVVEYERVGKHGAAEENSYVAISRALALCIVVGKPGSFVRESGTV
jgi:superfamily I DNA and RNA helicase